MNVFLARFRVDGLNEHAHVATTAVAAIATAPAKASHPASSIDDPCNRSGGWMGGWGGISIPHPETCRTTGVPRRVEPPLRGILGRTSATLSRRRHDVGRSSLRRS